MRARVLPFVFFGCLLAFVTSAHADDASEAKRLFDQGRKALAEGRVGPACEAFSDAKRLAPEACGVVQNLATCRQQQGRYLDAWNEFDALSACASKADQPDRVKFADDQRASLRGKLGFLALVVGNGPALAKLSIDSVPIDVSSFHGKPRTFEAGLHRLEIQREGCQLERLEVTLVAGIAQQLVLPATCGAATSTEAAPGPAVAAATPPAAVVPPHDSVQPTRWQIPVGWGAVGVGALAIVGAFAPCGLIARDQKRDGEDAKASSTAAICTAVAIGGAAVAATGLVLVLTAPSKKPATSLSFAPRFSPREASVAATLRF